MVDNKTTNKKQRAVSIAPSTMVAESVAEWPLHRVVEHLRKVEKDEKNKGALDVDCRMFGSSGVRLFLPVVEELAEHYDVSKGKMCRWLSYHGIAFAREANSITNLTQVYSKVRKIALERDSRAIADIQNVQAPYAPLDEDGRRVSFYVYSSWVASAFGDIAHLCGVSPAQITQIHMVRSVLTSDLPLIEGIVGGRLRKEWDWWCKWMTYRIKTLEMAVNLWDGGEVSGDG